MFDPVTLFLNFVYSPVFLIIVGGITILGGWKIFKNGKEKQGVLAIIIGVIILSSAIY